MTRFDQPGSPGTARGPRWLAVIVTLALALTLGAGAALSGAPAAAQPATPAAAAEPGADPALVRAVEHLLGQQDEAGGFAGFSGEPDPGVTTDAVVALRAASSQGIDTAAAIDRAVAYLAANGGAYAETGPGQAAKLALAAISGGQNPRDFGGADLIAALSSPDASDAATPAAILADSVYSHALVLLALAAANEPVPPAMVEALREAQIEDGSWAFAGTTDLGAGDSNTTGLVLQALVATGNGADPMVDSGLAYLSSVQNEFGQFLYQAGQADPADANSTALAVQALIATGQDPSGPEWLNATQGLAVFQNVSGGFRYVDIMPADNLLATVQAIPALAGYALPVATACDEEAAPASLDATPAVIELPTPGRGQAPCVPLAPAA